MTPGRRAPSRAAGRAGSADPDGLAALDRLISSMGRSGIGVALVDSRGLVVRAGAWMAGLAGWPLANQVEEAEPGGGRSTERLVRLKGRADRLYRALESPWDSHTLHLFVDCTDEVLEDRERRRREQYLARAAEDSMDAILSLDTGGRIRYWNHGAERMFGYQAGEVLGEPYDLLVPDELKAEDELERIAEILERQDVLRNFETIRLGRGGRRIEVDITITRLRDEAGGVLGRSVIYRDISLRRSLEEALRENLERLEALKSELSRKVDLLRSANLTLRRNQERLIELEKLSAIGEVAARVAHEFRTPLVTIGGFAHTVWKSLPADAPEREYLEIIRDEVRRLESIVSEILDYARGASLETEPSDVNAMVGEALRSHLERIRSAGIEVRTSLAEGLPQVPANRHQIHQALTNLLVNAMQALEPLTDRARRITIATERGENHVRISIADNGQGIPERHRERVFRPFFTTKPAGSGLGLAIASQIVARHRGTLTFESGEAAGTTFHLRLPMQREAAALEDDPGGR